MKAREIKGSVIWRLPGSSLIQILESEEGDDKFFLQSFDKHIDMGFLKGNIKQIQLGSLQGVFNRWSQSVAIDQSSTAKASYIQWVEQAKSTMKSGLLSKVVLARRQWKSYSVNMNEVFNQLLSQNANALVYAFYLHSGLIMIGATPETLLKKSGEDLYTEALGGTLTRGKYTDKEYLEHSHISDYVAHILKSGAYNYQTGKTVSRPAGLVEHLLTPFVAQSKGFEADIELACHLHPTSAVCGVPFQSAFDFIQTTEDFDRKYYSGFLGPVTLQGDFNFFVNLRCAEIYAEGLVLYAGAGLNEMSDAEDEWQETDRKMQTIVRSL